MILLNIVHSFAIVKNYNSLFSFDSNRFWKITTLQLNWSTFLTARASFPFKYSENETRYLLFSRSFAFCGARQRLFFSLLRELKFMI